VHIADPETLDPDVDALDNQTACRSAYYLATTEDIDPADLSGCAVFFNDPPSKKFNGNIESAVGTCNDVLEESCINALRSRVEEIFSDGGQCSDLETELSKINKCADFTGEGKGVENFTVISLAGLMSLPGAQNASSDCWPVSPNSDGLAYLGGDVVVVRLFFLPPLLPLTTSGGTIAN
jgi:hypothetical protein